MSELHETHKTSHADVSLPLRNKKNPQAQMITRQTEVRSTKCEVRQKPGGHSLMVPPGPIPNPEVKHQHVDGSRTTGPARVDSCQGKQAPQNESSAGLSFCRGERSGHGGVVLLPSSQVDSPPPHRRLTPSGQTRARLSSRPYSRRASCRTTGPARVDSCQGK